MSTLSPAEHREFVQAAWRTATPELLARYVEMLHGSDATIDDIRKALEMAARATGTDAEKKDPHANLQTVHITFLGNAAVAVEAPVSVPADDALGAGEQGLADLPTLQAGQGTLSIPWPFPGDGPADAEVKELAPPPKKVKDADLAEVMTDIDRILAGTDD